MTITLTPEQEKIIAEQIGSGHYHSPEDVITQGLGMLRAQEEFIRTHTVMLREAVGKGLEQIKRAKLLTALRRLRHRWIKSKSDWAANEFVPVLDRRQSRRRKD